eukprot:5129569-Amphidinium_carterae.1
MATHSKHQCCPASKLETLAALYHRGSLQNQDKRSPATKGTAQYQQGGLMISCCPGLKESGASGSKPKRALALHTEPSKARKARERMRLPPTQEQ